MASAFPEIGEGIFWLGAIVAIVFFLALAVVEAENDPHKDRSGGWASDFLRRYSWDFYFLRLLRNFVRNLGRMPVQRNFMIAGIAVMMLGIVLAKFV